jgi:hypothetical protein
MKISEVTIETLKNYIHVNHTEDDTLLSAILVAGRAFIMGYTGLPLTDDPTTLDVIEESLDDHEDLTIALLVLSAEMYDNRSYSVDNKELNNVVRTILQMHSINNL